MKIFAENYRGFKWVEIDLDKVNFLVGDNSSGKSSLIYLIDAISKNDLHDAPRFDEDFGIGEYDYFSPYFDFSDIVFGYSDERDGCFAKIITVKRVKNSTPNLIRCSYFSDGKMISFRKRGSGVQVKLMDTDCTNNESFVQIHKNNTGYRNVDVEENLRLSNPGLILAAFDQSKDSTPRKVFRKSVDSILNNPRVVSPTRALPEKFYTFRRKFNAHGLHFASMLMDFSDIEKKRIFEDIEKFGEESKLFSRIKVRRVSDRIDDSPLIVSVEKSGKEFLLNQVGVGVSQVVPVLIETLYCLTMPKTFVLMQQPELHLHPIAQAAFGSYLLKVTGKGLRPVLETHSSFLIDRFRSDLREKIASKDEEFGLTSSEVAILFCSNSTDGNKVHKISVSDDGALVDDPDEFHAFFVDELVRTMF